MKTQNTPRKSRLGRNRDGQSRFGREDSFKPLLNIYKTTKIPWLMLILVVLISFGTQFVSVTIAEYSAKIDTGTMTGGSFLVTYIALTLLSIVFEYGYDLANGLGKSQMSRNVRKKLWGKMLRLPVRTYEEEEPQRLVSRVTKDTEFAYSALTAVIQLVSIVYGIIIAMVEVVQIFGSYSWIMAAIIPVLIICSVVVGKIQYFIDRMINAAYSKVTNFYSERLPNIAYIKSNNMEAKEYEKGLKISNEKYKADIMYKTLYALSLPFMSLANYISLVFVLIVASAMVRAGSLSGTEMKELLLYFDIVIQNATLILGVWQAIQATHGGCEKISRINDAAVEDSGGTRELTEPQDIVFKDVSFGYSPDVLVLKNASFTIPQGKITAIVGANGCGKSTITRLLERFDEPADGEILLGEYPLREYPRRVWRERLGYVFQGNQMVHGTVGENIAYGVEHDYTQADLVEAARNAQAYDFIADKEKGFDTPVGVFDSEFSGGQIQRLALARVFMKDPEYLIMDEATSGVDVLKEQAIFRYVREKMQGRTVVIISHTMNVVKIADHVVTIADGCVEDEGTYEELAGRSRVLMSFLQADQASGEDQTCRS